MSRSAPGGTEEEKGHQPECHPIQGSSALSWQEHPQESPRHQGKELWYIAQQEQNSSPLGDAGNATHSAQGGSHYPTPGFLTSKNPCRRNWLTDQRS